MNLLAKAVECAAVALERQNDVTRRDGLAARVLSVSDGVTKDVVKKLLEEHARLFIHLARDALDAGTACETADGRLCDALDVVAQHLLVSDGAALGHTLATFTFSFACHVDVFESLFVFASLQCNDEKKRRADFILCKPGAFTWATRLHTSHTQNAHGRFSAAFCERITGTNA